MVQILREATQKYVIEKICYECGGVIVPINYWSLSVESALDRDRDAQLFCESQFHRIVLSQVLPSSISRETTMPATHGKSMSMQLVNEELGDQHAQVDAQLSLNANSQLQTASSAPTPKARISRCQNARPETHHHGPTLLRGLWRRQSNRQCRPNISCHPSALASM